ncbi:kinesin family member 11 [Heterostelium album PN500]|uniref:Kinesin family member 11 n=1 Tax=Heterostelium pallidum (strain ATCC 26659 / Pp 5 / PN500) TaxID=670386 RepID=D3AZ82_HETP5|nr:kinesin family member 11 [Heterostelium album PN500]EFA85465.1 kinesin family member 11 [Heterostelium album PN500]|eukprot:XP_020437573.1 kinesin family member 11 [Heterostelium album PN500]
MNENISVVVRARPFNDNEVKSGFYECWQLNEGTNTITSLAPKSSTTTTTTTTSSAVKTPSKSSPTTTGTGAKFIQNSYIYDHLFPPNVDNAQVYDTVAKQIIWSTMEGYNGTIFAYGQTASGKTFTMKGSNKRNPGIIPLAIQDVFSFIQETQDREFLLRVSYMEIYNEVINDLMAPESLNLKIHEKPNGDIYVGNLKEEIVLSPEHVLNLIAAGESVRHVGSTNFNDQSSRSHTIFRLVVESKERAVDGSSVRVSYLNLIDLAGSEKASEGVHAMRNKEGAFINKSLLTLGSVISKLSEKAAGHINYRDSKLTRILQNSLSGNSRIAIVCTITLASNNFDETHSTLKFASRAKKITNNAKVNEVIDDKALIKQYRNEIAELKTKLEEQLKKERDLDSNNAPAEELKKKLLESEKHRNLLESKIQHLTKLILVSGSIQKAKRSDSVDTSDGSITPPTTSSEPPSLKSSVSLENQELLNRISKLELELREKDKQLEEYKNSNSNNSNSSNNNNNNNNSNNKISELESKLKEKEENIVSLEFRMKGYMDKFKSLISQNEVLKQQLAQTQKELDTYRLEEAAVDDDEMY